MHAGGLHERPGPVHPAEVRRRRSRQGQRRADRTVDGRHAERRRSPESLGCVPLHPAQSHALGTAQTRPHPLKRTDYQPEVLDAGQIRQLLQGFHGHPLEAWLICSATLGLRTEEALGLKWGDINLTTGHVHIRRGLQWVTGHELTVEPKTELSRRTVVLPRFAVMRLRQIKGKGRLIRDLNPNQVDRRYRAWCRQHGLPCVPRRNLRHSWATTALAAGVDVAASAAPWAIPASKPPHVTTSDLISTSSRKHRNNGPA